jgi:T4 RnlA family RNA ligase
MVKHCYTIPTFDQAVALSKTGDFSHSVQTVDGEEIHSFKYCAMGNDIWKKELIGDGRLNMRGLTFDSKGNLLCLPFFKFFNFGEIIYTQGIDLPWAKYYEKVDGSLMSFFLLHDQVHLKTMKNYYSEVAQEARVKCPESLRVFARCLLEDGFSPMCEYVSPTRQIVCWYDQPQFYFLGARCMATGRLFLPPDLPEPPECVKTPRGFGSFEEVEQYLQGNTIEGVVGRTPPGLMFKLKGETYVQLHRIVSGGVTFKRVVEMIVDGKLDDLKGTLVRLGNEGMAKQIDVHEQEYHKQKKELMLATVQFIRAAGITNDLPNGPWVRPRKEVAMAMQTAVGNYTDKALAKFLMGCCFSMLDGKDTTDKINNWILMTDKNNRQQEAGE